MRAGAPWCPAVAGRGGGSARRARRRDARASRRAAGRAATPAGPSTRRSSASHRRVTRTCRPPDVGAAEHLLVVLGDRRCGRAGAPPGRRARGSPPCPLAVRGTVPVSTMDGDRGQPCQRRRPGRADVVGRRRLGATTTSASSSPVATASMPSAARLASMASSSMRSPNGFTNRDRRPTISYTPSALVVAGEVAGRQLVERAAEVEVRVGRGVAEHHVRARGRSARRHRLAWPSTGRSSKWPPGIARPIACGWRRRHRWRQVGHPRRRLGLSVHHVQVGAPPRVRSPPGRTPLGGMRPPACVTRRSVGTATTSGPARSSSSNVCGTPATLVTRARIAVAKHGSTTEAVVTDDPGSRRRGGSAAPTGRSSSAVAGS